MKKLCSIALILLLLSSAYAQENNFALLSDIQIGLPNADKDLQNVITDINNRDEIKFVIVTGNLTASGRDNDLEKAKELLAELTVPCHIIPGPNDFILNESGCAKINELWQDDKFTFVLDGVRHIGINSTFCGYNEYAHINSEDMQWLEKLINQDKEKNIYFYISNPADSVIDNWYKLVNLVREKNIKVVFTGIGKPFNNPSAWNKILNYDGIPGVTGRSTIKPPEDPKSKKKTKGTKAPALSWGYTFVEDRSDSLLFYEITSDSITNLWGGISKDDTLVIPQFDSTDFNTYSDKVTKKWETDLESTLYASLYSGQDRIFAVTQKGIIYCFDLAGNLKWKYDTGGTLLGCPVRDNDILSLATFEGDLFSFNVNNGKVVQVLSTGEHLTSQLIKTDVVNSNGLKTRGVVLGCASGKVICYDMYTFEQIWENNSAKGMIESEPLEINGKLIFSSCDNYLYCIDSKSGVLNWKWQGEKKTGTSSAKGTPVSDGKYIFVSESDNFVSAVDLLLGTTVWRKKDFNNGESIGLSADKQKLFIKSTRDIFYYASAKDGKLIKEINAGFGEDNIPGMPLEWGDNILFGSENGIIYLIDKQNNIEPLLYTGNAAVNTIININDNLFAASNVDGKIIVFEIK